MEHTPPAHWRLLSLPPHKGPHLTQSDCGSASTQPPTAVPARVYPFHCQICMDGARANSDVGTFQNMQFTCKIWKRKVVGNLKTLPICDLSTLPLHPDPAEPSCKLFLLYITYEPPQEHKTPCNKSWLVPALSRVFVLLFR